MQTILDVVSPNYSSKERVLLRPVGSASNGYAHTVVNMNFSHQDNNSNHFEFCLRAGAVSAIYEVFI